MTLANLITLGRIGLIPCFVISVVYYADGVKKGSPQEWHQWLAVAIFFVATISDALDGYVARRMNQRSRLGSILDPIADKALLLTSLFLLSYNPAQAFNPMPLWFPIVVISRDIIVILGVAVVFMMGRGLDVVPHWIGKLATVLQMITIGMFLMKISDPYWEILLWSAGICTVISGVIYVIQGMRKIGV
jgi:cardiolipin synthase (CMP-forming)